MARACPRTSAKRAAAAAALAVMPHRPARNERCRAVRPRARAPGSVGRQHSRAQPEPKLGAEARSSWRTASACERAVSLAAARTTASWSVLPLRRTRAARARANSSARAWRATATTAFAAARRSARDVRGLDQLRLLGDSLADLAAVGGEVAATSRERMGLERRDRPVQRPIRRSRMGKDGRQRRLRMCLRGGSEQRRRETHTANQCSLLRTKGPPSVRIKTTHILRPVVASVKGQNKTLTAAIL